MGEQMYKSTLLKLSSIVFCLLFANSVWATDFVDLKFGQYQTADSQWNTSSCYYSPASYNGCQIYSKNPGKTYKIPWYQGQLSWATGDYIKFAPSGNATYPWTATQYNSNGTVKAVLGTGKVIYAGLVNGDGYFFFMGNDNNTGQLFSISQGMNSSAGLTFTGDINPDVATLNSYAATYGSTTPLASGESASNSSPPAPTPVYSSGITAAQSTKRTSKLSDTASHGMEAHVNITGGSNTVDIDQHDAAHYLELTIIGNSNTVDIDQDDPAGVGTHFGDVVVEGNSNTLDLLQTGSGSKTAFIGIDGNSNTIDVIQKDSGQHYLQLDLIGDGHNANIIQEGSGNHSATVELNNGGGAWDFDLNQKGTTDKEYSLPHSMSDGTTTSGTCYVAAGCTLNIIQND